MTFQRLRETYRQKGIYLVASRNNKKYYLTIVKAPFCVEGIENEPGSVRLTGSYTLYYRPSLEDAEAMSRRVFEAYKQQYRDNPIMLSYVP